MTRLISFLQELFIRKLGPPVLGAFIAAWIVLNWEHLLLLFWGNGPLEERIIAFTLAMDQPWYKKYGIPAVIAFLYLAIFPYLSWGISVLQTHAKQITHSLRVNTGKQLLQKERELNVARVLADPNKGFIEDLAKQEVERERLRLERQQADTEKAQADAEMAVSEAAKRKAEQAENELSVKRSESEKLKLEAASKIQKAKITSNRFPAVYMLMKILDDGLKDDGVILSFEQITSIIAILFGYSNFEQLVNDPQFNNETIDKLLGVLYNADTLSEQIYRTLANDEEVLEHFDPSFLYDYFDEHPQLKLLTQDALDDVAQSFVENGWYELLDHEGVISVMADTNIIYDEVVDIVFNDSVLDEHGYKASFLVTIEGYERREASVRGLLPISIRAAVRAPLILGQTGLGRLSFEDIKAEVVWPE